MFLRQVCVFAYKIPKKYYSTLTGKFRITILGANGRSGQPLAMMLKNSNYVDEIALYDIGSTKSFAMELAHIDTKCIVKSYNKGNLNEALKNSKIVVIVASDPNVSNLSDYNDMFEPNAEIIFKLIKAFTNICPNAFLTIASNPINSLVPLASDILKHNRVFDEKKVFGVTSLDVMRTNVYAANIIGAKPEKVKVPVIGGHSQQTIVPVLSRCYPQYNFNPLEILKITNYVQTARDNLIKAKKPSTLAMSSAFAVAKFVISLVRAIKGETDIIECAYVRSNLYSSLKYLATPLKLSSVGIERNLGLPPLSDYEEYLLQSAYLALKEDIKMGEEYCDKQYNFYKPDVTHECEEKKHEDILPML